MKKNGAEVDAAAVVGRLVIDLTHLDYKHARSPYRARQAFRHLPSLRRLSQIRFHYMNLCSCWSFHLGRPLPVFGACVWFVYSGTKLSLEFRSSLISALIVSSQFQLHNDSSQKHSLIVSIDLAKKLSEFSLASYMGADGANAASQPI